MFVMEWMVIWGSELGCFLFGLMHSFDYCSFYWGKEMGKIKGKFVPYL